MKLRIKGNSLRLRVTQSETRQLATGSGVSEFITVAQTRWVYCLASTDSPYLQARLADNQLTVLVPKETLTTWANSDQVTLDCPQRDPASEPSILVEKDFACLTPRTGDDDADTFPHPSTEHQSC